MFLNDTFALFIDAIRVFVPLGNLSEKYNIQLGYFCIIIILSREAINGSPIRSPIQP